MNTFVVAFKIMKPHGAARGNLEGRRLVRHALACAWNQMTKGKTVVEDTELQIVVRMRRNMFQGNGEPVTSIKREGMHAAGAVSLAAMITSDFDDSRVLAQVFAIKHHRETRRFDCDFMIELYLETQLGLAQQQ